MGGYQSGLCLHHHSSSLNSHLAEISHWVSVLNNPTWDLRICQFTLFVFFQKCAPGFYRDGSGLYLGLCVPCECNGRADECEDRTGRCSPEDMQGLSVSFQFGLKQVGEKKQSRPTDC
uniref:Uncharacterized protein n=1 Tax=Cynoglossus semilaevis TaxID=244447 RepID=A0A3P8WPG2_CYNSE